MCVKQCINLSLDEDLIIKAKRVGLNISDYVNTSLSVFLTGVPDTIIKQYVALSKTQKKEANRKLLRISKELFGGEVKK